MEPIGLLTGKKNEFVVLKLSLNLIAPAQVTIQARVLSQDGKELADLKEPEAFRLYWSLQIDGAKQALRDTNVNRSYFPGTAFLGRAGRSTYYLVLIGPNPIPRPAKVEAIAMIEGVAPTLFEAELAELPEHK